MALSWGASAKYQAPEERLKSSVPAGSVVPNTVASAPFLRPSDVTPFELSVLWGWGCCLLQACTWVVWDRSMKTRQCYLTEQRTGFFLLPIRFLGWCPSPAGPIHTSLEWGLYQPPYWQEFLVLWILHNKKKVSLWPKILFKKNCGNNSHTTNGRVKRWKPVETRSAFSHLLEVVLTQLWRRTQNSTDYVRALQLVS